MITLFYRVLVTVPAAPLGIQSPAHGLDKAVNDEPSVCTPVNPWKTHTELLAPGFSASQPQLLRPSGELSKHGHFLSFCLSLSHYNSDFQVNE